jgi:hypothetical protein
LSRLKLRRLPAKPFFAAQAEHHPEREGLGEGGLTGQSKTRWNEDETSVAAVGCETLGTGFGEDRRGLSLIPGTTLNTPGLRLRLRCCRHDLRRESFAISLSSRRTQPIEGYRHEPPYCRLRREAAGCCERMEAVRRELVGRNVIA